LGYWSQLLKAKTQEAEPKGAVGGALSLETMMPAMVKKYELEDSDDSGMMTTCGLLLTR
jgi:hypothetical protein